MKKESTSLPPITFGEDQARLAAINNARWRLTLISILGGCCEVCGGTDLRTLEIDHRAGNGYIERRRKGYKASLSWRKQVFDPHVRDRLACLCANCHRIKTFESDEGHPHRKYSRINLLELAPYPLPQGYIEVSGRGFGPGNDGHAI